MIYYPFCNEEFAEYPVVILAAKPSKNFINQYMVQPFGIADQVLAIKLECTEKGSKAADKREYLSEDLLPTLDGLQTNYVVCTDGAFFKILTGIQKLDAVNGYIFPCKITGFEHLNICYSPSPQTVAFKPAVAVEITRTMECVIAHATGNYAEPGQDVIHFAEHPKTLTDIREWLNDLLDEPALTMDIEAWSLDTHEAGIGTITFCWNQHEGISFCVDKDRKPKDARRVRKLLRDFFEAYIGKSIWHNAGYDVTVLIYELFMDGLLDQEGLLHGLEVMCRDLVDTKIIAYLALNSTSRPKLGLKPLSQEYLGDYAEEDIKDIDLIPTPKLLTYNLKDGLGTWYVYNKYLPLMQKDEQEEVFNNIFKPALTDIIQMQLTGVPVDMQQVKIAKKAMQKDYQKAFNNLRKSDIILDFEEYRKEAYAWKKNHEWKKKRITASEVPETEYIFNPNSNQQLQELLFDMLELSPIDYTKAKQPSTNAKSLKALKEVVTDPEIKQLIADLLDIAAVSTILNTFIPAMERAKKAPDGMHYMFGNFNLGGTISGRLSSSNPNLQNLPSTGTKYAKVIKQCFIAPDGWLFVGLDFWSLEDRISALTTRDPAKLKVYLDGFDGHSLRAYSYFPEEFPDIDPESVESINSIEDLYKALRQDSKPITFALTYKGTWLTLHKNLGYPVDKAKLYEERYHKLYAVSDEWVAKHIEKAVETGYVTVAFGLRVRAPILHQCILGTRQTPFQAEKEARSIGNALGQSWGLLNNRAHTAFMKKVRQHEAFRLLVRPMMHIHDAQYFLIKDDPDLLHWVNENLSKECSWQEDPLIAHPQVGLGGDLGVFFPHWGNEIKLPNKATVDELQTILDNGIEKYYNPEPTK